jgi:hypothetical protein
MANFVKNFDLGADLIYNQGEYKNAQFNGVNGQDRPLNKLNKQLSIQLPTSVSYILRDIGQIVL